MDKYFADQAIIKFQKIFFGFALSKTSDIKEAEELASKIILEAYVTLLKTEGVENWDGYLYRIAQFVYARYVKERVNNRSGSIEELEMPLDYDFTSEVEKSEEYKILKREIAYLGFLQRNIIVMHYYQNLKINEIACKLNLSSGTVKWHLFDARNQLKKGFDMMRVKGELGLNPISFSSTGHDGNCGPLGDTSYYLNSKLKQNIAYAAYDQPRTIEEIADELGITPVFIEDEVRYLEDYGFLDKLSGGRYRTNIFITRSSKECDEEEKKILKNFAKTVCDEYVPLLISTFGQDNLSDIYLPYNDINYLLWSVIPFAVRYKLESENKNLMLKTNYYVKRKDGGEYIAFAELKQDYKKENENNEEQLTAYNNMTRLSFSYPIASWQLATNLDSRVLSWADNKTEDYEILYHFTTGKLPKVEALADKYQRLYDRGLIQNVNGKDIVNVVMIKVNKNPDGLIYAVPDDFISRLPEIPEHLWNSMKETADQLFELHKPFYPEHMHKLLKIYNSDFLQECESMVPEELLVRGILKQPTDTQKKGLMTLVFSDVLPV